MSVFFTFWLWNVCSCVFAKFYKKLQKNWETNSCVDTTETFNVFERLLLILLTKVTLLNFNVPLGAKLTHPFLIHGMQGLIAHPPNKTTT